MIRKIDHINIVVHDLQAAKKFFLDFGFIVVAESKLEGEWIDTMMGIPDVKAEYVALNLPQTQTNLELLKFYAPEENKDPGISKSNTLGFRHLALEVKNIEAIVEKLKKKGIIFFSEIQVYNKRKKLCYFLGPEGIILELAEYY